MTDALRFTPSYTADNAPPRQYRQHRPRVTHIIMWRDEQALRWVVVAADARGERRDDPIRRYTRARALQEAGRMAKRTGARSLLLVDGENVSIHVYK